MPHSKKTRRVDPITGNPSTQSNAISYSTFKYKQKVDPNTGKPSSELDAIPYSTFKYRRNVDPDTGKPSNASNTIPFGLFRLRRKVNPVTGKPSTLPNAIPYSTFIHSHKVNPDTGKPSTEPNAIAYHAFNRNRAKRQRIIQASPISTSSNIPDFELSFSAAALSSLPTIWKQEWFDFSVSKTSELGVFALSDQSIVSGISMPRPNKRTMRSVDEEHNGEELSPEDIINTFFMN